MDDIAILLRMVERILTVVISGGCIFLGYRLFFHLPYRKNESTGELELPGVKFTLTKVGPGIFFAAFGALVLVYSMTEKVSFQQHLVQTSDAPSGKTPTKYPSYSNSSFLGLSMNHRTVKTLDTPNPSLVLQALAQINCAFSFNEKHNKDTELKASVRAPLMQAKYDLVNAIWKQEWGDRNQLSVNGPTYFTNTDIKNIYNRQDNCLEQSSP